MKSIIILVSIILGIIGVHSKQPTVLEKLRDDPDLSQVCDPLFQMNDLFVSTDFLHSIMETKLFFSKQKKSSRLSIVTKTKKSVIQSLNLIYE
jgi:hypothetical protein